MKLLGDLKCSKCGKLIEKNEVFYPEIKNIGLNGITKFSKWKHVIFLLIAILITYTSQDIAYLPEAIINPIYVLTTLNMFAFLFLLLAIFKSINNIRKNNSEPYIVSSMMVIVFSVIVGTITFFITAMWWG